MKASRATDVSKFVQRALPLNARSLAESRPLRLKRLDHGSDVSVLENRALALACSADGGIHHRPGQVVGPNHLVREQHPKRGVDRSQQAVTEIRFLSRLHGVDVRRPEEVNPGEPRRE